MLNSFSVRLAAALFVATLSASGAHATLYSWNYTAGMAQPPAPGGYEVNSNGGAIQTIVSTFDSNTKRLTFDVQFGPPTGSGSLQTEGFWLVLNGGPNPKAQPGEYAIFYFDGRSFSSPKLTVYGYNGENNGSSWYDGNGSAAGTVAPDLIKGSSSSEASSFINSISAGDSGGRRRFSFDIDATSIINRTPLYPAPDGSPWFGTGYSNSLGIWMHSFQDFDASYYSTGKKGLKSGTAFDKGGYLDGSFFPTVPAPGSTTLLALGGAALLRRRR